MLVLGHFLIDSNIYLNYTSVWQFILLNLFKYGLSWVLMERKRGFYNSIKHYAYRVALYCSLINVIFIQIEELMEHI